MGNDNDICDRILEIVRAALLNNYVKVTDNIFEVGGDSLTFLEICSQIEDEFGIEIPLEAVWDAPSIADFSSVVADCRAEKDGQSLSVKGSSTAAAAG